MYCDGQVVYESDGFRNLGANDKWKNSEVNDVKPQHNVEDLCKKILLKHEFIL